MANHTPGPWREETDDNGDHWVVMNESHRTHIGNLEDTCGECHANAALIAAAPDLLVAAESLIEYFSDRIDEMKPTAIRRMVKLMNAIDKARGRDA